MRTLIILAAFMAIGITGAWEESNYLNYQFQKVIDTQAGENLQWFSGTQSGANFFGYGPNGYLGADTSSYASSVYADEIFYQGQYTDTYGVLTQYGSASIGSKSADFTTPGEIMSFGSATAGQNVALSGLYNYAQFWGDNYAQVSQGEDSAYTYFDWDSALAYPSVSIWANGDSRFTQASMGMAANVGFEQLMAPEAIPVMSGGYNAWGSFAGAYNPNEDQWGYFQSDVNVDLSGAGKQGFIMYNWD